MKVVVWRYQQPATDSNDRVAGGVAACRDYLGVIGNKCVVAARIHDISSAAAKCDANSRASSRTLHLGVVKNDRSDGGEVPKSVRTCRNSRVK
jgi:hypothetical protein